MKEMSSQLSQSLTDEEVEQIEEDIKVLRQILDNLLAFSFSQEDLLKHFKQNRSNSFDFICEAFIEMPEPKNLCAVFIPYKEKL
jgi:hypothetical protein